eukprot:CAMPEP_0184653372 /NCGR_PEP_ID=MMETSP0308-20130426/11089_1 /TAXON_ID=38269 /ORGANISM="Gloeochaete witrockiana, Strain SAG 46.84" /LENGTH=717 /DNA_ID=CAMNT_0027088793 /DNA_START=51 /DNA_END=2201 /DNA_ORIENTATION=+
MKLWTSLVAFFVATALFDKVTRVKAAPSPISPETLPGLTVDTYALTSQSGIRIVQKGLYLDSGYVDSIGEFGSAVANATWGTWSGFFRPAAPGRFSFRITVQEAGRLYFDSGSGMRLLVNCFPDRGAGTFRTCNQSGDPLTLVSNGNYRFELEAWSSRTQYNASMLISYQGLPFVPAPKSALFRPFDSTTNGVLYEHFEAISGLQSSVLGPYWRITQRGSFIATALNTTAELCPRPSNFLRVPTLFGTDISQFFFLRITGFFTPTVTADYQFRVAGDDGIRFLLWKEDGTTTFTSGWRRQFSDLVYRSSPIVTLTAGVPYPLVIEMFQYLGDWALRVQYFLSGVAYNIEPSQLSHISTGAAYEANTTSTLYWRPGPTCTPKPTPTPKGPCPDMKTICVWGDPHLSGYDLDIDITYASPLENTWLMDNTLVGSNTGFQFSGRSGLLDIFPAASLLEIAFKCRTGSDVISVKAENSTHVFYVNGVPVSLTSSFTDFVGVQVLKTVDPSTFSTSYSVHCTDVTNVTAMIIIRHVRPNFNSPAYINVCVYIPEAMTDKLRGLGGQPNCKGEDDVQFCNGTIVPISSLKAPYNEFTNPILAEVQKSWQNCSGISVFPNKTCDVCGGKPRNCENQTLYQRGLLLCNCTNSTSQALSIEACAFDYCVSNGTMGVVLNACNEGDTPNQIVPTPSPTNTPTPTATPCPTDYTVCIWGDPHVSGGDI